MREVYCEREGGGGEDEGEEGALFIEERRRRERRRSEGFNCRDQRRRGCLPHVTCPTWVKSPFALQLPPTTRFTP